MAPPPSSRTRPLGDPIFRKVGPEELADSTAALYADLIRPSILEALKDYPRPHLGMVRSLLPDLLARLYAQGTATAEAALILQMLKDGRQDAARDLIGGMTRIVYCLLQCAPANAIWWMDEELVHTLMETDPPTDLVDWTNLRLPYPGLFLPFARDTAFRFTTSDGETDLRCEGMYLVEDMVRHPDTGLDAPALMVVATSEPYGLPKEPSIMSKLTRYASICEGQPMPEATGSPDEVNNARLIRFAVNFALAWRANYVATTLVRPAGLPTSAGKIKKLERQGRSTASRTIVTLGSRAMATRPRNVPGGEEGTDRAAATAHWVRGHWRSYWTLDPKGAPTFGTKVREDGKTLHRLAHWLLPFHRGATEPTGREYVVRG